MVSSRAGIGLAVFLTLVRDYCYEGNSLSCSSSFLKYSTLNSASLLSLLCFIFSCSSFLHLFKLRLLSLSFSNRNSRTLFSLRNVIFSFSFSCNICNISCRPFDNLLLLSDFRGSGFFSTFSVSRKSTCNKPMPSSWGCI